MNKEPVNKVGSSRSTEAVTQELTRVEIEDARRKAAAYLPRKHWARHAIESLVPAALAYRDARESLAALEDWHCESQGCVTPDGLAEKTRAYRYTFHDYKQRAERAENILSDVLDYLQDQEDADFDGDKFRPNRAMSLCQEIREVLQKVKT